MQYSHPGSILKSLIWASPLSVTATAAKVGVTRKALSALINERAKISMAMAYKLETVFEFSARDWLLMQLEYDIAAFEHRGFYRIGRGSI